MRQQKSKSNQSQNNKDVLVHFRNISFGYKNHRVLENIDFKISKGQIVTIVGPNGAGKSTLAKLLLDILTPDEGEIVKAKNLQIGYVPQKLKVDRAMPMTVKRFLHLPKSRIKSSKQDFNEILKSLEISQLLSRALQQLSGGELQRVLLAHAMLETPNLMVLDEPADGVSDIEKMYRFIKLVRDKTGCAVFLISHDLNIVMAESNYVVCLNQKGCCHGDPHHISENPQFKHFYGEQAIALYQHQ